MHPTPITTMDEQLQPLRIDNSSLIHDSHHGCSTRPVHHSRIHGSALVDCKQTTPQLAATDKKSFPTFKHSTARCLAHTSHPTIITG
jgi:hypothetical protein